ncbi:hypothetical protein [Singulisphaera sp. PoT]|uniref:hypothetical protein n=1 Tax=Singulisphaera sp. PoT TaxID=3411797 RepID=UPI003BF5F20B
MQKETPARGAGARGFVRSIWGSLVAAAFILFQDGATGGTCLIAWLYCPVWFLLRLAHYLAKRPRWGVALVWVGLPFLTFGLLWGNSILQNKIAEANARRVIAACEAYHAANGEFPKELDELVPRYLSSVPRAKYCLAGRFFYHNPESPMLYWQVVPPFLRKIYDFETRHWRYLD